MKACLNYFDYTTKLYMESENNNYVLNSLPEDPLVWVHFCRQEFIKNVTQGMELVKQGQLEKA